MYLECMRAGVLFFGGADLELEVIERLVYPFAEALLGIKSFKLLQKLYGTQQHAILFKHQVRIQAKLA
jgi:hypothetical protein